MFRWLQIRNFQAHEKLSIQLDPKVTVIVGPTDAGKSAVIRALKWLCLNRPGGQDFLRHEADGVSVRLSVGKHKIIRSRKGTQNRYVLDTQLLQAFGNDVPTEVAQILNVDATNFQEQYDAPFWLSQSSGHVSRELNRIVNLGEMDGSLQNCVKAIRSARERVHVLQGLRDDARTAQQELGWVPEAMVLFRRGEQAGVALNAIGSRVVCLTSMLKGVQTIKTTLDGGFERLGALLNVVKRGDALSQLQKRHEQLVSLIQKRVKGEQRRAEALTRLKNAQHDLKIHQPKVCPTCQRQLP